MARLFDDAQNEYLMHAGAPVSTAPFTMACWFYSDIDTIGQTLMWVGDKDVVNDYWAMIAHGAVAGDPLRFIVYDGALESIDTANGFSTNTWHHAVLREIASNNHESILDGDLVNKGTGNVDLSPDNADSVAIGMARDFSPTLPMSGRIAWPAIWNIALSDEEVVSLAAGTHPMQIRPANLVAFWPLGGLDPQHDRDIWGGYDMTAFSDAAGPGWADHPGGLIYPSSPRLILPAGVAPPAGGPAPHYTRRRMRGGMVGIGI